MATSLAASLRIDALASQTGDSPVTGDRHANMKQTTHWTNGTGSGQVNRVYHENHTLSASATDSFNTLAAGSLTDIDGQAIDLDELKGFKIRCTSGSIEVAGTTGNPMPLFKAAGDAINLAAGQEFAANFGAAGLDVTTNSLFEVTDTAGGSGSAYTLWFTGAQ